jgi:hypothetical protein
MIWNSPIWLNELLVNSIKFIVVLSMISLPCSLLYSFYLIYYKIIKKDELIGTIGKKTIAAIISIIVLSSITMLIFYLPKQVFPKHYDFNGFYIQIATPQNRGQRQYTSSETDKQKLIEILKDYKCRRSLKVGSSTVENRELYIDIHIFNGKKSSPYHMIINKDTQRVYSSGNIDFMYVIDNHDGMLAAKLFEFIDKLQ